MGKDKFKLRAGFRHGGEKSGGLFIERDPIKTRFTNIRRKMGDKSLSLTDKDLLRGFVNRVYGGKLPETNEQGHTGIEQLLQAVTALERRFALEYGTEPDKAMPVMTPEFVEQVDANRRTEAGRERINERRAEQGRTPLLGGGFYDYRHDVSSDRQKAAEAYYRDVLGMDLAPATPKPPVEIPGRPQLPEEQFDVEGKEIPIGGDELPAGAAPDTSLVTQPLPGGKGPVVTVAGKQGRFNFDEPPISDDKTPGKRYAFDAADGQRYYFQLEKQYQGGRWEDASHAEADYEALQQMEQEQRRAYLRDRWPEDIVHAIDFAAATNAPFDTLKTDLAPLDTHRQISADSVGAVPPVDGDLISPAAPAPPADSGGVVEAAPVAPPPRSAVPAVPGTMAPPMPKPIIGTPIDETLYPERTIESEVAKDPGLVPAITKEDIYGDIFAKRLARFTTIPETAFVKEGVDTSKLKPESLYATNIAHKVISDSGMAAGISITGTYEHAGVDEDGNEIRDEETSKHPDHLAFDIGLEHGQMQGDVPEWDALAVQIEKALPPGYDVQRLGPDVNKKYKAHHIHVEWDPQTDEERDTGFMMTEIVRRSPIGEYPPVPGEPNYKIARPESNTEIAAGPTTYEDKGGSFKNQIEHAEQFRPGPNSTLEEREIFRRLRIRAFEQLVDEVPGADKWANLFPSFANGALGTSAATLMGFGQFVWAMDELRKQYHLPGPSGVLIHKGGEAEHSGYNPTTGLLALWGQSIQRYAKSEFPQDERLQEAFFSNELPQAFGSMFAFLLSTFLPGGVFGALSRLTVGAFSTTMRALAWSVPSMMGLGAQASEGFSDTVRNMRPLTKEGLAIQKKLVNLESISDQEWAYIVNESEWTTDRLAKSTFINGIVGLSEGLPIARAMRRLDLGLPIGEVIFLAGLEEQIQESTQQFLTELTQSQLGIRDWERDAKHILRGGFAGGLSSAGLFALRMGLSRIPIVGRMGALMGGGPNVHGARKALADWELTAEDDVRKNNPNATDEQIAKFIEEQTRIFRRQLVEAETRARERVYGEPKTSKSILKSLVDKIRPTSKRGGRDTFDLTYDQVENVPDLWRRVFRGRRNGKKFRFTITDQDGARKFYTGTRLEDLSAAIHDIRYGQPAESRKLADKTLSEVIVEFRKAMEPIKRAILEDRPGDAARMVRGLELYRQAVREVIGREQDLEAQDYRSILGKTINSRNYTLNKFEDDIRVAGLSNNDVYLLEDAIDFIAADYGFRSSDNKPLTPRQRKNIAKIQKRIHRIAIPRRVEDNIDAARYTFQNYYYIPVAMQGTVDRLAQTYRDLFQLAPEERGLLKEVKDLYREMTEGRDIELDLELADEQGKFPDIFSDMDEDVVSSAYALELQGAHKTIQQIYEDIDSSGLPMDAEQSRMLQTLYDGVGFIVQAYPKSIELLYRQPELQRLLRDYASLATAPESTPGTAEGIAGTPEQGPQERSPYAPLQPEGLPEGYTVEYGEFREGKGTPVQLKRNGRSVADGFIDDENLVRLANEYEAAKSEGSIDLRDVNVGDRLQMNTPAKTGRGNEMSFAPNIETVEEIDLDSAMNGSPAVRLKLTNTGTMWLGRNVVDEIDNGIPFDAIKAGEADAPTGDTGQAPGTTGEQEAAPEQPAPPEGEAETPAGQTDEEAVAQLSQFAFDILKDVPEVIALYQGGNLDEQMGPFGRLPVFVFNLFSPVPVYRKEWSPEYDKDRTDAFERNRHQIYERIHVMLREAIPAVKKPETPPATPIAELPPLSEANVPEWVWRQNVGETQDQFLERLIKTDDPRNIATAWQMYRDLNDVSGIRVELGKRFKTLTGKRLTDNNASPYLAVGIGEAYDEGIDIILRQFQESGKAKGEWKYDHEKAARWLRSDAGQAWAEFWEFTEADVDYLLENFERIDREAKEQAERGWAPTLPGAVGASEGGTVEQAEVEGPTPVETAPISDIEVDKELDDLAGEIEGLLGGLDDLMAIDGGQKVADDLKRIGNNLAEALVARDKVDWTEFVKAVRQVLSKPTKKGGEVWDLLGDDKDALLRSWYMGAVANRPDAVKLLTDSQAKNVEDIIDGSAEGESTPTPPPVPTPPSGTSQGEGGVGGVSGRPGSSGEGTGEGGKTGVREGEKAPAQPDEKGGVGVPTEPVGGRSGAAAAAEPAGGERPTPTGERTDAREIEPRDHRITVATLGGEGPVDAFNTNLAAIKLANQIVEENRPATPEEQEILARYVGWGGIREAFDFTSRVSNEWHKRAAELKALLTKEEYTEAAGSTLNAHYTSIPVIRAIWDAINAMGFTHGHVLEPSAGIGHFLGAAPDQVVNASSFLAIERDLMTGKILQLLYPLSDSLNTTFENAAIADQSLDLVVGNVPFGTDKPADPRYAKEKLLVHDYFFAKALDKLRPGGLLVLITSSGTMDKKDGGRGRRYISERAALIGAIRLPTTAFKDNARTEVTTDVIVLQKRGVAVEHPADHAWANVVTATDFEGGKFDLNEYFSENPTQMLGAMQRTGGQYASQTRLVSRDLITQTEVGDALDRVMRRLPQNFYTERSTEETGLQPVVFSDEMPRTFTIDGDGKIWWTYRDDKFQIVKAERVRGQYAPYLMRRGEGKARKKRIDIPDPFERLFSMIELRNQAAEVINVQLRQDLSEQEADALFKDAQAKLNELYDAFHERFGPISQDLNIAVFRNDLGMPLLQSIEKYNPDTGIAEKGEFFYERTVGRGKPIDKTNVPEEALAITMLTKGKVDLAAIARMMEVDEGTARENMRGLIFRDPNTGEFAPADEYLAGFTREKLVLAKIAARKDPQYQENVDALKESLPKTIPHHKIRPAIGAKWIPLDLYKEFINDRLLDGQGRVTIHYAEEGGGYTIEFDRDAKESLANRQEYHAGRTWDLKRLLNVVFNNREVNVQYTVDRGPPKITAQDRQATARGIQLIKQMQEEFKLWLWNEDAEYNEYDSANDLVATNRRDAMVWRYNEFQNNIKLANWNGRGTHMTFPGMNPIIREVLFQHQRDAVWRSVRSGNTLLAHQVGLGKTFVMIASAMEYKRLGLATKPMIAVPSHVFDQVARDFQLLYPSAKVLMMPLNNNLADVQVELATAATQNWDAIIVRHADLLRIPVSKAHEKKYVETRLAELAEALAEASRGRARTRSTGNVRNAGDSIRQIQTQIRAYERQLEVLDTIDRPPGVTFEQSGVDYLIVDEAHEFKNLHTPSHMNSVKGVQRGQTLAPGDERIKGTIDLHMKTEYLRKLHGGPRGVMFATGTPVANSMTELYTMFRYLRPDILESQGLKSLAAWIMQFGFIEDQNVEWVVEGGFSSEVRRLVSFRNVAELLRAYKEFADIKLAAEDLGDIKENEVDIPRPPLLNGKMTWILTEPTESQQAYIDDVKARGEAMRDKNPRMVMTKKGMMPDQFLKLSVDARKASLSMRLHDPDADPATAGAKIDRIIQEVYDRWVSSTDVKGTQLIFLDFGTPGTGRVNLYADIRDGLVKMGVPAKEIEFIQESKDSNAAEMLRLKGEVFKRVRLGETRVLIGSTLAMGTGMNVQTRLVALHHADIPWRPADLEQREGRILRMGNVLFEIDAIKAVEIIGYGTEGSFDTFMFDTVRRKLGFIKQLFTSDMDIRDMPDVMSDVLLDAQAIVASTSGDPNVIEKVELDKVIGQLGYARNAHENVRADAENKVEMLKAQIARAEEQVGPILEAIENEWVDTAGKAFAATVDGTEYSGEKARSNWAGAIRIKLNDRKDRSTNAVVKIGYIGLTRSPTEKELAKAQKELGEEAAPVEQAPKKPGFLVNARSFMDPMNLGRAMSWELVVYIGPAELRYTVDPRESMAQQVINFDRMIRDRIARYTTPLDDFDGRTAFEEDQKKKRDVLIRNEVLAERPFEQEPMLRKAIARSTELVPSTNIPVPDIPGIDTMFDSGLSPQAAAAVVLLRNEIIDKPDYSTVGRQALEDHITKAFDEAHWIGSWTPNEIINHARNILFEFLQQFKVPGAERYDTEGAPIAGEAIQPFPADMDRASMIQAVEYIARSSELRKWMPQHFLDALFNGRIPDVDTLNAESVEADESSREVHPDDVTADGVNETRLNPTRQDRRKGRIRKTIEQVGGPIPESMQQPGPLSDRAKSLSGDVRVEGPDGKIYTLGMMDEIKPLALPMLVEFTKLLGVPVKLVWNRDDVAGFYRSNGLLRLHPDLFGGSDLTQSAAARVLAHEIGHLIDHIGEMEVESPSKRGPDVLGKLKSLVAFHRHTLALFSDPNDSFLAEDRAAAGRQAVRETLARYNVTAKQWRAENRGRLSNDLILRIKADISDLRTRLVHNAIRERQLSTRKEVRDEVIRVSIAWRPGWDGDPNNTYRNSANELYADAISALLNAPNWFWSQAPIFYDAFFANLKRKPEVYDAFIWLQKVVQGGKRVLYDEYVAIDMRALEEEKTKAKEFIDNNRHRIDFMRDVIDNFLIKEGIGLKMQRQMELGGAKFHENQNFRILVDELRYIDTEQYALEAEIISEIVDPLEEIGIGFDEIHRWMMWNRVAHERYRTIQSQDAIKAYIQNQEDKELPINPDEIEKLSTWAGRMEIASPGGMTPAVARESLAMMKEDMGEENFDFMVEKIRGFQRHMFKITRQAMEAGLINKKVFDQIIEPNIENYASFRILDYVTNPEHMTATVNEQIGTLGETGNVFLATYLKGRAQIYASAHNRAKLALADMLFSGFPNEIEVAKRKWHKGEPIGWGEKTGKDGKKWFQVTMRRDGVVVVYNVQSAYIHRLFDTKTNDDVSALARIVQTVTFLDRTVARKMFIDLNLGFSIFNAQRDVRESLKKLPGYIAPLTMLGMWMIPGGLVGRLAKQYTHGIVDHPIIKELLEGKFIVPPNVGMWGGVIQTGGQNQILHRALDIKSDERTERLENIKDIDSWFQKGLAGMGYGIWRMMEALERSPIGRKFEAANKRVEIRTKIANALVLKKFNIGKGTREQAYLVRNYLGTPNFRAGGTYMQTYNSIFMFGNIMLQGWRSHAKIMTPRIVVPKFIPKIGGKVISAGRWEPMLPDTTAAYWIKTAVLDIMPKIFQAYAELGMLNWLFAAVDPDDDDGKAVQEFYNRIGAYDKTNYIIVPIGQIMKRMGVDIQPPSEYGGWKSGEIRLPHDETGRLIGGLVYNGILAAYKKDTSTGSLLNFAGGQLPSMSPSLNVITAFGTIVGGGNPIDDWYGRPVLQRRTQAARKGSVEQFSAEIRAHGEFMMWVIDKFGIMRFNYYNPSEQTTWEAVISNPLLNKVVPINRLIKYTDSGVYQQMVKEIETDAGDKATARLGPYYPKIAHQLNRRYGSLQSKGEPARIKFNRQEIYEAYRAWHSNVWDPLDAALLVEIYPPLDANGNQPEPDYDLINKMSDELQSRSEQFAQWIRDKDYTRAVQEGKIMMFRREEFRGAGALNPAIEALGLQSTRRPK